MTTTTRFISAVRAGASSWRLPCDHDHDRLETADSCAMARGVAVIVIDPSETSGASAIVTAPYLRARRRTPRAKAIDAGVVVSIADRRARRDR